MNRKELMTALKLAEPALGAKEATTVFQCFRFDGKTALAYNDMVAVSVPCGIGLKGGLNGKILLGWLGASKARAVELEGSGEDAKLKAGRSRLNTPLVDDEDFVFSFPADKAAVSKLTIDALMVESLDRVSICMGQDQQHPWRLGVTVSFEKGVIRFFTSDNVSAARDQIDRRLPTKLVGLAFILPPRFVELLLAYAKRDDPKTLLLGEGWLEAKFESGLRLWSRTIEDVQLTQFEQLFENLADRDGSALIPKGFDDCLKRMQVPLSFSGNPAAKATIKNSRLTLFADSPMGQVKDVLKLSHEDAEILFSPDLVRRAIGNCTRIKLTEGKCVLMENGESFDHVIALGQE